MAHRHLMTQNVLSATSTVFNLNGFVTVQKLKVSFENKGKHLTEPKRRLGKSKLQWCSVTIPILKGKKWTTDGINGNKGEKNKQTFE